MRIRRAGGRTPARAVALRPPGTGVEAVLPSVIFGLWGEERADIFRLEEVCQVEYIFRRRSLVTDVEKGGSPRRSPTQGGYPRGEETRARLIAAALRIFGEEGYERASTRRIAETAGVTPPALQYYFDSKEGLHRACAAAVCDQADPFLRTAVAAGEAALTRGEPDRAQAALCELLAAMVDASVFTRDLLDVSAFISRVRGEMHTPAGQVLREKISAPLVEHVARLISLAIGAPVDALARLRANVLLSQVAAFHVYKDSTLSSVGWPDFEGDRRILAKAVLREHALGALQAARAASTPGV